jgi:hypothetical protein
MILEIRFGTLNPDEGMYVWDFFNPILKEETDEKWIYEAECPNYFYETYRKNGINCRLYKDKRQYKCLMKLIGKKYEQKPDDMYDRMPVIMCSKVKVILEINK